ncbi:MAG: hypothetical protein HY556_09925 [Euryarchaeota archaeon]|nr:hypothetical protein [Euryarchaeota archaeon]
MTAEDRYDESLRLRELPARPPYYVNVTTQDLEGNVALKRLLEDWEARRPPGVLSEPNLKENSLALIHDLQERLPGPWWQSPGTVNITYADHFFGLSYARTAVDG